MTPIENMSRSQLLEKIASEEMKLRAFNLRGETGLAAFTQTLIEQAQRRLEQIEKDGEK